MPKVIALSGVVGSGKSTVLESLYKKLSKTHTVYAIREYIDVLADSNDKLTAYLNGQLSAYRFQDYILDYFETSSYLINDYDYILVERCPLEGLRFFAKLDVKNGRMTSEEYKVLIQKAKSMTFYPNPSEAKIISIDTDLMTVEDITNEIISYINEIDIVQLRANPDTVKRRIKERGRQCEIDSYTDDYLKFMCQEYFQ